MLGTVTANATDIILPVKPGEILGGKYRVEQVLGEGGMGVVYVAEHVELREHVAVKVLHPRRASDSEIVRRFLREGRTAVKIRSEHVARILDVGTHDTGHLKLPYIVMELLEGHDLEHELELAGPLPMAVAVGYLLQAIDDARCVDECEMLVDAGASNKYSVPAAQKGGNTLKCRILHAVKALTDPESADASSYCRAAIGEAPCNRFGRC